MEDITKVIIPAAGQGTRFLPFTKAIPKEMLPLLEKPALQRIIEEGMLSDVRNYIIVTARGKNSIEDHFDSDPALENFLKENEKESLVSCIDRIIKLAEFTYVRQQEPLGLGHAIWLARHCIQKEYFGVMLPDDIIISKQPALDQLIRIARQEKASVIAVQEVPMDCVSSYGIISVKKQLTPHLFQVGSVVEKPSQKNAPSNLAIIGRYVLSNKIFSSLDQMKNYSVGELQLTDGIAHMIQNNEKVFAYKVQVMLFQNLPWLEVGISYTRLSFPSKFE